MTASAAGYTGAALRGAPGAAGGYPRTAPKPPGGSPGALRGAPPFPSGILKIGKSVLEGQATRSRSFQGSAAGRRLENNQAPADAEPADAAADAKKTISAIEEIMKNLPASPDNLIAHLNTIAEKIPQFKAVIKSILECAKNPDLSNQNDHLNKIRTSLDELREIVNKKTDSEDKKQLLDKLDAIINTAEKISRRLTDEAADPEAAAEAGQAPPPPTAGEIIAIITGLVAVCCVTPGYIWVSCNGGFANAFALCCCIEDYLKRLDEWVGYKRTPNRVDPNTSTPGAPVDFNIVGELVVGIELT